MHRGKKKEKKRKRNKKKREEIVALVPLVYPAGLYLTGLCALFPKIYRRYRFALLASRTRVITNNAEQLEREEEKGRRPLGGLK